MNEKKLHYYLLTTTFKQYIAWSHCAPAPRIRVLSIFTSGEIKKLGETEEIDHKIALTLRP